MKLGLIGYPLGHSWSPEIHETLIHQPYELFPIRKDGLDDFFAKRDFDGINVTIPYKQDVIAYLDEIEENAKQIGAVNCIVNRNGKLTGYNTDFFGFEQLLANHHIDVKEKTVAVLGSGGASKAVVQAIYHLQGKPVVISRKDREGCITYEKLYEDANQYQIIVNTTPVGMFPDCDGIPVDLTQFPQLDAVVDIVANPLRTRLQFEAKRLGIPTCGGFEMLVGQALFADELFLDQKLDRNLIDTCVKTINQKRRNIVLIGMPTSGKSTIAKELGKQLGIQPIEMDDEIVNVLGTSIKECFQAHGEAYFRKIETEVAKRYSHADGNIISCGGGVIKTPDTMRFLSENGLVIWIDRDIHSLYPTDDRPLSTDIATIQKMYEERLPLYKKYSDIQIKNNSTLEDTIQEIMKVIR